MPYKNQMESYRTRKGQRFKCVADIMDESHGDLRKQAQDMVRALRERGQKAFFEKQEGGAFYRVFAA